MMLHEGYWTGLGSSIAGVMFMWAIARQYFPSQLDFYLSNSTSKLVRLVYPYLEITFFEYVGERLKRSEAYAAIEAYLADSCSARAARLKAEPDRGGTDVALSMDDFEEVVDDFRGAKLWWCSNKIVSRRTSFSFYPAPEDRHSYRLVFHRRHRDLVVGAYLRHVVEEGKAIEVRKRQRKLYTNVANMDWYERHRNAWSHVPFEHPATFDTLAMDAAKKQEIVEDLISFSQSKDYYKRIGKAWKRGYLLYGPPGTGKSTMIAAMANLLDYDVYDLELTAVKNNTVLRQLLIETASKSIIVIEDIDCSVDLSGKRKTADEEKREDAEEEKKKIAAGRGDKEESKVTLSGLLNFIDGIWSSCGGEKLIVFTTNHVEKLDPALVRRGRMDKHVELSYCSFEGFKVLAKNYLGIVEHPLFGEISGLLEEKNISPADVAENLMLKYGTGDGEKIEACLENLIKALKECKSKTEKEAETATVEEDEEAKE
ncbi:AAA-ATPase ASD, mitochondrial [Canna indica]|uniref:AAA-ATPase ASD, mitochondrial n=1 Tax=Canna indica TaxID=4628 RepID=A0AAQ3Q861_9LILI|nr:AAA-ATPase ASD, mitochondrial [Canna indica]